MKNKNNIFDLVDEIIERKTKEEITKRINEMYNDRHFIYSPLYKSSIYKNPYKKNKKSLMLYVTTLILIFVYLFLICILILCK